MQKKHRMISSQKTACFLLNRLLLSRLFVSCALPMQLL